MEHNTEHIKQIISNICTRIGVRPSGVEVCEDGNGTVFCIHSDHGHLLTDNNARGLAALNYIVKRVANPEHAQEYPAFSVDINNFQKQKNKTLTDHARVYAEPALSLGSDVSLNPMNAYERMVVHNTLSDYKGVETESSGFGRERHVVIKVKK